MPTLDEIRRWARGVFVAGLPRPKEAPPEEKPEAPPGGKRTRTYKVSADGTDALFKFGKHRGRTACYLAQHDPDYLHWMLRSEDKFDHDLLDVVRFQLEHGDDG